MYLYKGLIRPTLAYGVVIWAPHLQKDIEAIEAVEKSHSTHPKHQTSAFNKRNASGSWVCLRSHTENVEGT